MADSLDLAAARALALEDAQAGRFGACPYSQDRPLERHVYLRWLAHHRLTLAGYPTSPEET